MKNIDGRITFSIQHDRATIELKDSESSLKFAEVHLTSEQFMQIMSGMGYVECNIRVNKLEKVGKKMEMKELVFEIPKTPFDERHSKACEIAKEKTPNGWCPDLYFGSQNSYFTEKEKQFARTTIRRWV